MSVTSAKKNIHLLALSAALPLLQYLQEEKTLPCQNSKVNRLESHYY